MVSFKKRKAIASQSRGKLQVFVGCGQVCVKLGKFTSMWNDSGTVLSGTQSIENNEHLKVTYIHTYLIFINVSSSSLHWQQLICFWYHKKRFIHVLMLPRLIRLRPVFFWGELTGLQPRQFFLFLGILPKCVDRFPLHGQHQTLKKWIWKGLFSVQM